MVRSALLLLGDSRDRYLFGAVAPSVCRNGEPLRWTLPWTQHNEFLAHGMKCDDDADLAAFGFFIHYGVAPDGLYHNPVRLGLKSYAYYGWSGPGWVEGTAAVGPKADSQALALEAASRFRRAAGAPVVVMLSSQAWDIARRLEHEPNATAREWADSYQTNLTALASMLSAQLGRSDSLLLATSLHSATHPERLCSLASERMRAVARSAALAAAGVRLVDVAAAQARAVGAARGGGGAHLFAQDGVHPGPAGCAITWAAVRRALIGVGAVGDVGPLQCSARIVRQLSRKTRCTEGATFGCSSYSAWASTVWVSNGCRGVFNCTGTSWPSALVACGQYISPSDGCLCGSASGDSSRRRGTPVFEKWRPRP